MLDTPLGLKHWLVLRKLRKFSVRRKTWLSLGWRKMPSVCGRRDWILHLRGPAGLLLGRGD